MNKIYTLLLLLCLVMTSGTAWAESITESQARSIAEGFMASHQRPTTNMRLAKKQSRLDAPTSSEKAAYYVFNAPTEGYVIVAGDDRAPAVLGYSDRGTFDTQDVPEAMQALLDSYAEQIEELEHGAKAAPRLTSAPAIAPLVPTMWSQNNPYNILLPIRSDGKHAAAGCVATAMAQLMYYWQWPARPTTTIPAYTSSTLGFYMPALPPVDFNWDIMQDTYITTDTTSAAALAAATLTLYCAQSVEMDFKTSSSGATTTSIPWKLATYFDFEHSGHSIWRENYTSQEWADILYNEIAEGRPIIYSGSKKSGGHAFICDGYDGNGLFHFNWGWNGQSNGFFLLNVLNPEAQGTGSATGTYGYILTQSALIGLEPGNESSNGFVLTSTDVSLGSTTTTRTSYNYDFKATVTGRFRNYTSDVMAVSYGWGFYQGETLKSVLYETYSSSLRPGYRVTLTDKVLSFGKNISSGTYRIMPIYSEYSAGNWRPCAGADKNYIEVTISGNTCTITGHGTAAARNYTINDITYTGNMHNGRPVDITVNMTNNGESVCNLLYLFADGTFVAAAQVDMLNGETGDVTFRYMPETAGQHTLTWSWNDDGSNPIATRNITIEAMPAADLSATLDVLNVTDGQNMIITSDTFSVDLEVTNNGSEPYNEDISISLYKHTYNNYGTRVQSFVRHIDLGPGETTTLHFDMDQVFKNWKFFVKTFYYSEGIQTDLISSSFYTIVFPEMPEPLIGDLNGDGARTIRDVTLLINYLLSLDADGVIIDNADVNGSGSITISDVTSLINLLLSTPSN